MSLQNSAPFFKKSTISQQILIIDSQVDHYQQLIASAGPEFEVFVLDAQHDGIAQITQILTSFFTSASPLTLHLVSHGAPGCLYLGNSQLSLNTLEHYTPQLKRWFGSSSPLLQPHSLLLYGCSVAAGDAGEEFISNLHALTQADIHASTQVVGNAQQGGTWQLNRRMGQFSPQPALPWAISTLEQYSGVFNNPPTGGNFSNPTLAGRYDTSGYAYDVSIAGDYAYVADRHDGLQIINIKNPFNPTLVGTYNTSGLAYGVSISGSYAYVADRYDGLQIIDISTPSNPTLVGTYDTTGNAWDVSIVGNYAYVADYESGLQIIDISNPSNPSLISSYDTTGYAFDVSVVGNYAYVADYSSGLQIIDISNPLSPVLVGNYDTFGIARGVSVAGRYAYVADDVTGLQIIDISTPSNPTFAGSYNTTGNAWDVSIVGNYAYVADYDGGLQIINVSNPSAPTLVSTANTPGAALGISVVGTYAYIADNTNGLQVIELGNPITITGTPSEDSLLTADTSMLGDADGLPSSSTYQYQWQQLNGSTWQNIAGATRRTFTPGDAQVDQCVRVQMTYTDRKGTTETVTSKGVAIANVNDAPTGELTIDGIPQEDGLLTANTSALKDADGLPDSSTYRYQWQSFNGSSWTNIAGATSNTFTPDDDYVNGQVRLWISYFDQQGAFETVASAGVTIANINDPATITGDLRGRVTEDAANNLATGSLTIADIDSPTTFIPQTNIEGTYGFFSINAAGQWSYALNNADADTNILVQNRVALDTFTVTTADGSTKDITITVRGANDNLTDFNDDGQVDLLWRNYQTGRNTIWTTDGQTRLGKMAVGSMKNSNWVIEGIGDFNQDGDRNDILWRDRKTDSTSIWLMDGSQKIGQFSLVQRPNWDIQGVGDFDHDGFADDILWHHPTTQTIAVGLMNGSTQVGRIDFGTVEQDWQVKGIGDFNGSGHIDDLVWQNQADGRIVIWQTNGERKVSQVRLATADLAWEVKGVSDFDGDHQIDDLLLRNRQTGAINTWQTQNFRLMGSQAITPTVANLNCDVVV